MRYMLVDSDGIPIGAIELDDNVADDIEENHPDLEIKIKTFDDEPNGRIRNFMLTIK